MDAVTVTIKGSRPYVRIAGGLTGMRETGLRRNYTTTFLGCDYRNQSKAEISRLIRQAAHRAGVKVTIRFEVPAEN